MKKTCKTLLQNFILCGLVGWCIEIIFTSFDSFRRRDLRLKGTTSLWMFPIYGMAAFLSPIMKQIKEKSIFFRGGFYAFLILSAEFVSGSLLSKHKLCPWNYKKSSWNINGVIRLDYFPCWFAAGLLYEKLLTHKSRKK